MQKKKILSLAQNSQLLEQRIAENVKSQQIDLVQWIFERLQIKNGWRVLEFCCGTGSQTLRLLKLVGSSGHVVAIDVAEDVLQKLKDGAGKSGSRLTTVASRLEDFTKALKRISIAPQSFDLLFCAYGLYYSDNPTATLQEALSWLKPKGRIAIVGPYRANNGPLFNLLIECGVDISPFVVYTSRDFMEETVLPWAVENFSKVGIHTLVNYVTWQNVESVITYWKNTTFYDDSKLSILEKKLKDHFKLNHVFINEKWVMMMEMQHE